MNLYYRKLFISRFKSLDLFLKIFFFISFFTILSIELFLNKYPANSEFQYNFGRIIIKICYSYFSASLFYFLIVFLPKERKKLKVFRFLNNTIHLIKGQKDGLILEIIKFTKPNTLVLNKEISLKEISFYCGKVDPNKPIKFGKYLNNYDNYFELINQRALKIKSHINDLIAVNELLDDELFLSISNINNIVTESLKADKIEQILMNDLSHLSYTINDLNFEVNELENIFRNGFHKKYAFQYHHNERQRNKRRKK